MLCRFLNGCSTLIILTTFAASPCAPAEDYSDLIDLNFKADGTFAPFPSKPAKGLMTSNEFTVYKTHLDNLECDAAETILNTAFVRAYPQHSRAKKTSARHNLNHNRWIAYALSEFMEYGYCNAFLDFQVAEKYLNAKSIPLTFYTPNKLQPEFFPYAKRDKISDDQFQLDRHESAIGRVVSRADGDFIPAILKIAEWVRRGDVFDISDDKTVEYYLLARARHLGHGSDALKQRLQELSRLMPEARRRDIEQKSRAKRALIIHVFDDVQPL